MLNTDFKSIMDLLKAFPNEQTCIKHLEQLRWPNGNVVSPFDSGSKVYTCKNGRYKCAATKKYFNVKTGTCFEGAKIPLTKWFLAIYLVTNHKKGISSVQLANDLSITQKSAWFLLMRLRVNCKLPCEAEKMEGAIESDESFFGGANRNRHANKKHKYGKGRRFEDKATVLGFYNRETNQVRCFQMKTPSIQETIPLILTNIKKGSILHTDEWRTYHHIKSRGYVHKVIRHNLGKYVDGEVTTNRIENFWSVAKRTYKGTYIKVSKKHLQHYLHEMTFRFNHRLEAVAVRMNILMKHCNTRLKWKTVAYGEL